MLSRIEQREAVRLGLASDPTRPPGIDEDVAGEAARRLADRFDERVRRGELVPGPASTTDLPKPLSDQALPVAMLDTGTRVLYQGLVGRLVAASDRLHDDVRAARAARDEHINALMSDVVAARPRLVVMTDVQGFGTDLPHDGLADVLQGECHDPPTVTALIALLMAVMGAPVGVPQCLHSTRTLQQLLLRSADRAILAAVPGATYRRVGDDFAVGVANDAEATSVLSILAEEVGRLGLHLHPGKTEVLAGDRLADLVPPRSRPQDLALHAAVDWTRDRLSPAATRVAMDLFWMGRDRDGPRRAMVDLLATPAGDTLVGHRQRKAAMQLVLRSLTGMRDPAALPHLGAFLAGELRIMNSVARYLGALYPTASGPEALARTEDVLRAPGVLPLQETWLAFALESVRQPLPRSLLSWATEAVARPDGDWIVRPAVARVLAAQGRLGRDQAEMLWSAAPAAGEAEVLGAAARGASAEPSLAQFVDSHRDHLASELVASRRGRVRLA